MYRIRGKRITKRCRQGNQEWKIFHINLFYSKIIANKNEILQYLGNIRQRTIDQWEE